MIDLKIKMDYGNYVESMEQARIQLKIEYTGFIETWFKDWEKK